MKLKGIVDEDVVNYRKTSMYLAFPSCDFKCEKGSPRCCQNSTLASSPDIDVDVETVCMRYIGNPITSAIVCAGLEPMDSFDDLLALIRCLRKTHRCDDDIVIYTGYTEGECTNNGWIKALEEYSHIIVKFGRYRISEEPHRDEILGVNLASWNQYAIQIS